MSQYEIERTWRGRDVPAASAHIYIEQLVRVLAELNGADFDARIASGGGRMNITMDRYQADWDMVKRGWDTHVSGLGRKLIQPLRQLKPIVRN